MKPRALFGRLARLCDLPGAAGAKLVRGCLEDRDASPDHATIDDYEAALPELRARLLAHLGAAGVEVRMRALEGELSHQRSKGNLENLTAQLRRHSATLEARLKSGHSWMPPRRAAAGSDDE